MTQQKLGNAETVLRLAINSIRSIRTSLGLHYPPEKEVLKAIHHDLGVVTEALEKLEASIEASSIRRRGHSKLVWSKETKSIQTIRTAEPQDENQPMTIEAQNANLREELQAKRLLLREIQSLIESRRDW